MPSTGGAPRAPAAAAKQLTEKRVNDDGVSDDELIDYIGDAAGELTPEEAALLLAAAKKLAKKLKDDQIGPCRVVDRQARPGFKGGQGMAVACSLLLCSDGVNFTASGNCEYNCKPKRGAERCPCGTSGNVRINRFGGRLGNGGSGDPCTVNGKSSITIDQVR